MRGPSFFFVFPALALLLLASGCRVMEQSSRHEFQSGYYRMREQGGEPERVYVENADAQVRIYPENQSIPALPKRIIPLQGTDSLCFYPYSFSRVSLDIDLTTMPFKYRFPQHGLPAQLNTEFNGALYAGRRYDRYSIRSTQSLPGSCAYDVLNRGYDYGVFAGIGSTAVNAFTTRGAVANDYFAPHLQAGTAIFLESRIASFGVALGTDLLLSPDRKTWIYTGKPWLGFIVGLALN